MKETYKIEKLEDMPMFVPIIFIKDNGLENSKPRMVGNNIHDEIVIETGGNYLYYYNLQCGESSHKCSDFRFVKREASCYDDEFYSHFCQMVDLEKLVSDYTKQVRKEVCEEIRKWCDKNFNWVGDGTGYDGQDYNEMIGSNNAINKLRKFLDQMQGGKNAETK